MTASTSPLLALPRELRDKIYEYTFDVEVRIDRRHLRRRQPPHAKTRARNGGLCLANKQLHKETIDLYYEHMHFISYDRMVFGNWFYRNQNRDKLKHLKLVCVSDYERHGLPGWTDITRPKVIAYARGTFPQHLSLDIEVMDEKDLPQDVVAAKAYEIDELFPLK